MGLHSLFESAVCAADDRLDQIERAIWVALRQGSQSAKHPWHHGIFCTISNGDSLVAAPAGRTVILRSVDQMRRTIDCHTDVRSGKIADLVHCPCAAWTFYDHKSKMQLRVSGVAEIHDGKVADEAWRTTSLAGRRLYASDLKPGQVLASQQPEDQPQLSLETSECGRANLRVVRLGVRAVDWLYLRRSGHLRVMASYSEGVLQSVDWVAP